MGSTKKRGRPKKFFGKKVTFNLSFSVIKKLKEMTILGKNASLFIEDLINQKWDEKRKGTQ